MKFLLFLISLPALAICINAGGQTTFHEDGISVKCFADTLFASGGTPFTDPAMGADELATLRYCVMCAYAIPEPPGLYTVTLDFVEPPLSLLTGQGQRVFTVTVNGAQTPDIDLWKLTGGAGRLYTVKVLAISAGVIRIDLKARVRNAIVNRITVEPANALDLFGGEIKLFIEREWRRLLPLASCLRLDLKDLQNPVVIHQLQGVCGDEGEWWVVKEAARMSTGQPLLTGLILGYRSRGRRRRTGPRRHHDGVRESGVVSGQIGHGRGNSGVRGVHAALVGGIVGGQSFGHFRGDRRPDPLNESHHGSGDAFCFGYLGNQSVCLNVRLSHCVSSPLEVRTEDRC